MAEWDWTIHHNCPVCGKMFWITEKGQWAYKKNKYDLKSKRTDRDTIYFCSWRCMRKYEKRPDMTEKETR